MRNDFVLALHIMGFLTAADSKPLSSQTLADTYGTNPVVVRRILSKLSDAGLVTSQRGVGGGTVLALDPEGISLRDIYRAVTDHSTILPRHPTSETGPSGVLGAYVNRLLGAAEEDLLAQFEKISISDMDEQVRPAICSLLKQTWEDEKA